MVGPCWAQTSSAAAAELAASTRYLRRTRTPTTDRAPHVVIHHQNRFPGPGLDGIGGRRCRHRAGPRAAIGDSCGEAP